MVEHTLTLLDGRTLSYALYGPEEGQPVLYFHGTPSSRLEILLLNEYGWDMEEYLQQHKIRIVAPERPGMGFSDFHPQGSFLSFAGDVKQLLHHVQIKTCSLLSWSGGGPFGLAMAYVYPGVVKKVAMLCGFTRRFDKDVFRQMHWNKGYFWGAKYWPWLLRVALHLFRKKKIHKPPAQWITGLPPSDYDIINNAERFKTFSRLTIQEACRKDARGAVHEASLYFRPFGFELFSILQPVRYWWGVEDRNVIRLHPEALQQEIPGSLVHYIEKEGHLSLYVKYFFEALKWAL